MMYEKPPPAKFAPLTRVPLPDRAPLLARPNFLPRIQYRKMVPQNAPVAGRLSECVSKLECGAGLLHRNNQGMVAVGADISGENQPLDMSDCTAKTERNTEAYKSLNFQRTKV